MKRILTAFVTLCLLSLMLLTLPVAAADTKTTGTGSSSSATTTDSTKSSTTSNSSSSSSESGTDTDTTKEVKGGLIALTFDDGPSANTAKLLDAFKKRNIKATFFVVGEMVEEYPEIIKREYNEGHEIGNHTYNHVNLANADASTMTSTLNQTTELINTAAGKDIGVKLVRPPYGSVNDSVKTNVAAPLILWSVDTLDWKTRDADAVKAEILRQASDGAIVLMHDLYATSVDGCIAALDELKKEGYTFVTVSELFRRKGETMENGVTYTNAEANGVDLGPLKETTKEDSSTATKDTKKETKREDKGFPWGLLIFCGCILALYGAGMFRVLNGKPVIPERKEPNHEKAAAPRHNSPDRHSNRYASQRRRDRRE